MEVHFPRLCIICYTVFLWYKKTHLRHTTSSFVLNSVNAQSRVKLHSIRQCPHSLITSCPTAQWMTPLHAGFKQAKLLDDVAAFSKVSVVWSRRDRERKCLWGWVVPCVSFYDLLHVPACFVASSMCVTSHAAFIFWYLYMENWTWL